VTAGQVNDCTQAIALLGERKVSHVLADKGYDTDPIVEHVATMGAVAVIPPKRNRKQQREYDKDLYKQRNRIRTLLLAPQTLPPLRHSIREKQSQLPRTRSARLHLAHPEAICRYSLEGLLPSSESQVAQNRRCTK
jgi:transposase